MSRPVSILFWTILSAAVLASRLAHLHILWADEDYHLAAAIQVLHGKLPYRDFWYDKPPLNLLFYLLFDARTGLALRLADSAFVVACCGMAWRFATKLWSSREGYLAAAALAFFSIFYLAPGVIPEEPDTLSAPSPRRRLFGVSPPSLARRPRRRPRVSIERQGRAGAGLRRTFLRSARAANALPASHSQRRHRRLARLRPRFRDLLEQVWKWGLLDAGSPFSGFGALFGWAGFHVASHHRLMLSASETEYTSSV